MNTVKQNLGYSQTLIALAVLATFGPAHAQDIGELTAPGNKVSVGISNASGDKSDRARFGVYNGLRNHDTNALLGLEYLNRDEATGTWTSVFLRNLELGASREKQGDWKLNAGYNEITSYDPRYVNTGMIGAGTTTPTVVTIPPDTGYDLELKLKRKAVTLGGEKWFLGNTLQFQVDFKSEDKNGARQFGKGFACSTRGVPNWSTDGVCVGGSEAAQLLLPEPINSNTKQIDAKLNYHTDKLMISGGYYGSFYSNSNDTLTPIVPGPLNAPASPQLLATMGLPIALPPDNQAQQLYFSGNYRFTPTTKATFKYSYTHATQDDSFADAFAAAAPPGVTNLGGEVNTSRYQAGLTARPMPKLSFLTNVSYEDRKDKTPIAYYNLEHATAFTNDHNSLKKLDAKVEGTYRLPYNYQATAGVDYKKMDRGTPVTSTEIAGLTALREKTEETTYRAEMRKTMSETLSGALKYSYSDRDGSQYTDLTTGFPKISGAALTAANATSLVVPSSMTDRTSSKWKLSTNWTPAERLSMQFWVENAHDNYAPPVTGGSATVPPGLIKGLESSDSQLYSMDASFVMSEDWKANAYYSHGDQRMSVNHSTGYMANPDNKNDTFGIGIKGKPTSRLKVGADLSYIKDKSSYDQTMAPGASAGNIALLNSSGGLPDTTFKQTQLKLFGEYAVQKTGYVRLDYVYQKSKLDDWTWGYNGTPYLFSDNTSVQYDQKQSVNLIAISYVYKFK